jgi:uncharacterized protein (DUF58 family)
LNRVISLSVLAFGLILFGLGIMTPHFLVLALPVVVYVLTGLIYGQQSPQVSAERHLSARRVSPGMPVTVKVTLTNRGEKLEQVWVRDPLPVGLEKLTGDTRCLVSLGAGESKSFEYSVRAQRGSYHFSSLQASASDILGLVRRTIPLNVSGLVAVLPDIRRIPTIPLRPQQTRGYPGTIPARLGGAGIAFFGVREYQVGDSMHQVNWRASARHPHMLYSNDFEQERAADVGLILDCRRESYLATTKDNMFEHAVIATASLAQSFLNDGNRVGLVQYGQYVAWTFPGYGKIQRERIMAALAQATPGISLVDHLEHLPVRFFPPRSQIILISPIQSKDLDVLFNFRSRGYALMVISPNPVAFELAHLPGQASVRMAGRIARLERGVLLNQLQQANIRVLDWDVQMPFEQAVLSLTRGSARFFVRGA